MLITITKRKVHTRSTRTNGSAKNVTGQRRLSPLTPEALWEMEFVFTKDAFTSVYILYYPKHEKLLGPAKSYRFEIF